MTDFKWEETAKLYTFIEKVKNVQKDSSVLIINSINSKHQLRDVLNMEHADWPALLRPYLQYIYDTISTMVILFSCLSVASFKVSIHSTKYKKESN